MKQNKRNRKQIQLLKELESNPLIETACRKVGIARSTYYRWGEVDPTFKRKSEIAQDKGRAKLNDFAESKLLENVQQNQHSAIAFWLSHNTARYRQTNQQFYASRLEDMKKAMWQNTDLLNLLVERLGLERILELAEADSYENLLEQIDHEYETEQIKRGYRGKYGHRSSTIKRFRYPDEIDL